MDAETVARVRCFNRTVTERVGALDESYLDRGRPLGETRLLWEIGPDGADVQSGLHSASPQPATAKVTSSPTPEAT